ncbi:hypothetical protein SAMN04488055_4080 [Chitinophaga niabensis]|uniref:Uncharacterized protein n=1 Tax=Chitinophaga niabensis TaxID=536979 RepID=A0A1N6JJ66_9BACT|nr:hypothetical protein SAMN04488055_4080 [Chitinophaga niabensis]
MQKKGENFYILSFCIIWLDYPNATRLKEATFNSPSTDFR